MSCYTFRVEPVTTVPARALAHLPAPLAALTTPPHPWRVVCEWEGCDWTTRAPTRAAALAAGGAHRAAHICDTCHGTGKTAARQQPWPPYAWHYPTCYACTGSGVTP